MLTDHQIDIIRTMTARPASGSAIVIGLHVPAGIMDRTQMAAILDRDDFRMMDIVDPRLEDDKAITVITGVDRLDGEYVAGMVRRLRFRNALICLLDGDDHTRRFLDGVTVINPA
jgi:hypothetical protein